MCVKIFIGTCKKYRKVTRVKGHKRRSYDEWMCYTQFVRSLNWEECAVQSPERLAWSTLRDFMRSTPLSLLLKLFMSVFWNIPLASYIMYSLQQQVSLAMHTDLKVTLNLCTNSYLTCHRGIFFRPHHEPNEFSHSI